MCSNAMIQTTKQECSGIAINNPERGTLNWRLSMLPNNISIPCACGCGTLIPSRDKWGNTPRFVNRHGRRRPLADRFWEKIEKTDTCWFWTAGMSDGYGRINRGVPTSELVLAHRLSWELHFGSIPNGMNVLHKCDSRPCVRPDHLFLGTNVDNTKDRESKGRGVWWGIHSSVYPRRQFLMAICKSCGKEFEHRRNGNQPRSFCSLQCMAKSRANFVSCPICGLRFIRCKSHITGKNYCSRKCYLLAHPHAMADCEVCGKHFPVNPSQRAKGWLRTCSMKCRDALARQRWAEAYNG